MSDTIAAIATAPGEGGIAIVRLSGPASEPICKALFVRPGNHSGPLPDHMLCYGHITENGETIDECMAVLMRAPHTYTREDVVEFQVHGGFSVASRVLDLCLSKGARLAAEGEFTRRAFLNGRLDLSQAEAVMALISARGEQARKAAISQLEGSASGFIRKVSDQLFQIQAGIAACIDYPEEISEEEAASNLLPRIMKLASDLKDACDERSARILRQGLKVALCGRPNAGKSSLLNSLLGEDKAIVTPVAGTTRDLVEGEITLDGCLIHLTDTAGMRNTDDAVEAIGVNRAKKAASDADLVLFIFDASQPLSAEDIDMVSSLLASRSEDTMTLVLNKTDLPSVLTRNDLEGHFPGVPCLSVCALEPSSLNPLKQWMAGKAKVSDLLALTQPRHINAARRAVHALLEAAHTLQVAELDLCTLDLDRAQNALSEITGDNVEETLLDHIFSTFCVGK